MRNAIRGVCALTAVALLAWSAGASATTQRTFVASNGLDTNACSLAAPCRTFGRAITQTNAGGEVIVLDSAGYGPVGVTKSITIAAPPGIYAGISVFTGDGVSINGASIIVVLRGLTINGQGPNGQGGDNGINVINAAMVHVEGCVIANMAHSGIWHTVGMLEAKDTIVRNSAYGIYVQAPGNTVLDHVRVDGNATGVAAEYGGQVAMRDSIVTASSNIGVVAAYGTSPADPSVTITRSLISFNQYGIYLDPGPAMSSSPRLAISDSTISDSTNFGVTGLSHAIITATHNAFLKNGGGLHLAYGAEADLDGNYLTFNGGTDVYIEAGAIAWTRGNNSWTDFATPGTILVTRGH